MSTEPLPDTKVVRARTTVSEQIREILRYRELLVGLVRTELKVKYKNSILGFVWSMLNPALYLVVFYVVFQLVLGSGIPQFAIWLLSGLLVWNLFAPSLAAATGVVVNNSSLVKKVYFPRTVLPLSAVGASLVHFFLQAVVLVGALIIFQYNVAWGYLWLVPIALVVLLLLAAGLSILLSAVNVYARDTQHLLELLLLAWFWGTPIVYHYMLVANKLHEKAGLYLLNPVTPIVLAFQRGIYGRTSFVNDAGELVPMLPDESPLWYLRNLGFVALGSLILLYVAMRVFARVQGNFAEEL
jgi:ABC-2 type transport system permease protein